MEKILRYFFFNIILFKNLTPCCVPKAYRMGRWFLQIWIYLSRGSFQSTTFFWQKGIYWDSLRLSFFIFLLKKTAPPLLCPHPTPRDNDFNKLEFTQPEGASKQVTNFLAKGFLKRFKRSFSVKIQPPLWLKHTMRIIKWTNTT